MITVIAWIKTDTYNFQLLTEGLDNLIYLHKLLLLLEIMGDGDNYILFLRGFASQQYITHCHTA